MTDRIHPGGSRRANHTGGVQVKSLASGELRYHARLDGKCLGSFETRAAALRAIEVARAELAAGVRP